MAKTSRKTCDDNAEVIAALNRVLADAKGGRVRAVGIAFVTEDRTTGSTSGIGMTDLLSAKLLNSAIAELQHEWFHAVRGR
jgi:hypothetical protein